MALETRPWTRAELDRLPQDSNKYELLGGVLLVTPAPSPSHEHILAWLNAVITPFVVAHGIGAVHHPRSVIIRDESQLEPDLMVLPPAKFDAWEDAPIPLLVVEVLSAVTRRRDLDVKRDFYMERGVAEYWAVDRDARCVVRIRPGESPESVAAILSWAPAGAAATLEIDVAAMLAAASVR